VELVNVGDVTFFGMLGLLVLGTAIAAALALRELGALLVDTIRAVVLWVRARREARRAWGRWRADIVRERIGLVPHDQSTPNLRVVPTPAPKDRR
jgi:hypothetical protein